MVDIVQKAVDPHLIPIGEGKAPPPLRRFKINTTTNVSTKTLFYSKD